MEKKPTKCYVNSRPENEIKEIKEISIILDKILSLDVDDKDTTSRIRSAIYGKFETSQAYMDEMLLYDKPGICGLVWTANFVAYRCRTCGISPCMSLCADCFKNGDHVGHDFNMFRSQAGGACDCGDPSVMRPMGFCTRHQTTVHEVKEPPTELLKVPRIIMPRIFRRLILYLRLNSFSIHMTEEAAYDTNNMVSLLEEFSTYGSVMRKLISDDLTDRKLYLKMTAHSPPEQDKMAQSYLNYQRALKSFANPKPHETFENVAGLQKYLEHNTFLDELVFWTIRYEFPQNIVCFLLNMLPDPAYKEALTKSFIMHYSKIAMILEKTSDPDPLSNRIVHVSVQLFSNERLAVQMTEKCSLLHVMIGSLKNMMEKVLIPNIPAYTIVSRCHNTHQVVDCSSRVMKEHCYWPLVSDLNNILSHRMVAVRFVENSTLVEMWLEFLKLFQGMNVNRREVNQHVEFEPNTYYAAFSAELEASAYPMWALLSHLNTEATANLTKKMIKSCYKVLEGWFATVRDFDPENTNDNLVSFHIPLHRYLALFICQAVNQQKVSLSEVMPSNEMLKKIIYHPLKIQVAFHEIISGLWIRNGLQIKGQAMTYVQCNFCSSMVDADLYTLQVFGTALPANTFMEILINRFHLHDSLTFSKWVIKTYEPEHELSMLEGFLQLVATLITIRSNLGVDISKVTLLEIVTLLCMADRPHSQIMELMPERCGSGPPHDFDALLCEVADYKEPTFEASGNLQQGSYVPKKILWEEYYNPIHVMLRSVHKKDFQSSLDRYCAFMKSNFPDCKGQPWPPYRLPIECNPAYNDPIAIIDTRVFHAVVWTCLRKEMEKKNMDEHVLSLAVYLLELLIVDYTKNYDRDDMPDEATSKQLPVRMVKDLKMREWFTSDFFPVNVRTKLRLVCFGPTSPTHSDDSGDIESDFPSSSSIGPLMFSSFGNFALDTYFSHSGGREALFEAILRPLREIDADSPCGGNELDDALKKTTELAVYHEPESIVSILLKLYLRFNKVVFQPDVVATHKMESRLGGAVFFIEKCLIRIMSLDEYCKDDVIANRVKLWPDLPFTLNEVDMRDQKELERKKKVKARQKLIMEQFATRQKQFLEESAEFDSMDWESLELKKENGKIYDCVICNQSSSSTDDSPMGLVALLQATSVLGHMKRKTNVLLPTSDEETSALALLDTRSTSFENRIWDLEEAYDLTTSLCSTNTMWSGGIHVQSCGHYVHLYCLNNYLISLNSQKTLTEKDEYLCPLCRQLANSVLPILQEVADSVHEIPEDKCADMVVANSMVGKLLEKQAREYPSNIDDEMSKFLSDLQSSTYPSYLTRLRPRKESNQNIEQCIFVNAVARTNVESEIMQRGGELVTFASPATENMASIMRQKSCLKPLLYALAYHTRKEFSRPKILKIWEDLTRTEKFPNDEKRGSGGEGSNGEIKKEKPTEENKKPPKKDDSPIPKDKSDQLQEGSSDTTVSKEKSDQLQEDSPKPVVSKDKSDQLQGDHPVPVVTKDKSDHLQGDSSVSAASKDNNVQLQGERPGPVISKDKNVQLQGVKVPYPSYIIKYDPSAMNYERPSFPVLLRDVPALLVEMLLNVPLNLDPKLYARIISNLYNLAYVQAAVQLSVPCSPQDRNLVRLFECKHGEPDYKCVKILGLVVTPLTLMGLYKQGNTFEDNVSGSLKAGFFSTMDKNIQNIMMPFMRVAAFFKSILYELPLPDVPTSEEEFCKLAKYLKLIPSNFDEENFYACNAIRTPGDSFSVFHFWISQLNYFIDRSLPCARQVITDLVPQWKKPRLLVLPKKYDRIFQYYHRKACARCKQVPAETSVCLICGTIVCLKEKCCKQKRTCEAVMHAKKCGAGTAIFLVVTTSYIIVVRGPRACLWGSVYLDRFGEEDRDLKRGKSLYLCESRYELLEQQWLSHRFDHTTKKWVWHHDSLLHLSE